MMRSFKSFFMGGFECAAHRRSDGTRLDLQASTEHDRLASSDYKALQHLGIYTCRDGLRWHAIETAPGIYDWNDAEPVLNAARETKAEVIWDLCHYGWPDWLDIWSDDFPFRFASFAAAAAEHIGRYGLVQSFCLINEISFMAWAGGQVGYFYPGERDRGVALKAQLGKASIQAAQSIRRVAPTATFVTAEPLINIVTHSEEEKDAAANHNASQHEAVDMLLGVGRPELGGNESLVDIVGLNFYPANQWYQNGSPIPLGHYDFRPLRTMLLEVFKRYHKPLLITETGAEGTGRSSWLHYVCGEVHAAISAGVPILGICIYPIVDCPGWDNDRTCDVGLLSSPAVTGKRFYHAEFVAELAAQQKRLETIPHPYHLSRL